MMDKLNQSSNPRISISRTSPQNPKRMPDAFSNPRIIQTSPKNPENAIRTLKSLNNPDEPPKIQRMPNVPLNPKIIQLGRRNQENARCILKSQDNPDESQKSRKCQMHSQIPG